MQHTAELQSTEVDQSVSHNPAQLVAAFEQFGRLSDQLQRSYQEMDQRAAVLTEQLALAQDARLEQLAEKEQLACRLESILDALPAGVLLVNANGVITSANPAAELFFEQKLMGKKWRRVYAHSVSRQTEQDLYLNSGRILGLKTQPIENEKSDQKKLNQIKGEIILLDDISEQRMLENLADRENRLAAMGQMAAGLAHQLRTPLASAVLYASQLNHFTDHHPKQNKAVEKVRTCLRYLEKLINDMLMYAKGGEFAEQTFLLDELLVAFNARIEAQLHQSGAQLKIISQLNKISLTGSLDALVSVLINLAENAIEACGENISEIAELELEVYQQADYLILVLRDNGPGLSVEQQSKIFQAFYTERKAGTGLGLAVAQSIVQAHHGDLLVRSQAGIGSSFYVCLPLNRTEQFMASGQCTPAESLKMKKAINKNGINNGANK